MMNCTWTSIVRVKKRQCNRPHWWCLSWQVVSCVEAWCRSIFLRKVAWRRSLTTGSSYLSSRSSRSCLDLPTVHPKMKLPL